VTWGHVADADYFLSMLKSAGEKAGIV